MLIALFWTKSGSYEEQYLHGYYQKNENLQWILKNLMTEAEEIGRREPPRNDFKPDKVSLLRIKAFKDGYRAIFFCCQKVFPAANGPADLLHAAAYAEPVYQIPAVFKFIRHKIRA